MYALVLLHRLSSGAFIGIVIYVAIVVFLIAALWLVFAKADRPGLGRHHSLLQLLHTCSRLSDDPGWWLILYLIPVVDIVVYIIVAIDLAKSFAKGAAFAAGLIFLPFIFIPILGFGPAPYVEPAASRPQGHLSSTPAARPALDLTAADLEQRSAQDELGHGPHGVHAAVNKKGRGQGLSPSLESSRIFSLGPDQGDILDHETWAPGRRLVLAAVEVQVLILSPPPRSPCGRRRRSGGPSLGTHATDEAEASGETRQRRARRRR